MAEPLIKVGKLETRLGRTFDDPEKARAEAFIADASALIRDIADDDFLDDDGNLNVPASIVPVVVSMVRRGFDNPRGLTSETLGDYTWQASGNAMSGIYATRKEKIVIRRAVSKLGAGTAQLEGYLPLPPQYGRESDITGSL